MLIKVKVKRLPHVAGGILDGMEKDVGAEPTRLAAMGFANKSGNAEEGCVGMKHDLLAVFTRMPQSQSDASQLFPLIIRKGKSPRLPLAPIPLTLPKVALWAGHGSGK